MGLEQTLAEKFQRLGPQQQQDVLTFIDLLQDPIITPPTEDELKVVDAIIARGIARAQMIEPQSPELVWQRFDAVRQRLANHSSIW